MGNVAPLYVYKIVPSTCPVREPLPERLPLSYIDQSSGFIHLLTALQVPSALKALFESEPMVYVLRIPFDKVTQDIRWETADGPLSEALPEEELCPVSIHRRVQPWDTSPLFGFQAVRKLKHGVAFV